jgi:hypothetical protein
MWRSQPWVHRGVAAAALVAAALAFFVNDTDLRVGLFGLIGTMAGALATFEGTQLAARRDRQARRRAAGRLLQEDLLWARSRCLNAKQNGKFWAPRLDLRFDGWERYRETVSEELASTSDWQKAASAFEAMRAVQSKCDALRTSYGERPGLGPLSHGVITEYINRSDGAIDALRALSGDRPHDQQPVADEGA